MIYFFIPCTFQNEFGNTKNTKKTPYIKIQYQEMA